MFRLFVVLMVVIVATESGRVDAGGLFKRGSRSGGNVRFDSSASLRARSLSTRSLSTQGVPLQSLASPYGFGVGARGYSANGYAAYGYIDPYAYDPYQYGSFEMQDPADDPYLREFYRYDTFFPGRRGAGRRSR